MPWYPAVAERDHDIQNPTSREKIRQIGEWLRLRPESRVLDIACGRGGPALILASSFGCRITGVERAPEFVAAARQRVADAGLSELIEIVESDGRDFPLEPGAWDAALCLGATFVWDDLDGTLSALVPAVRPGGHVVVGEPYWRKRPPEGIDGTGYVSLPETTAKVERHGVTLIGLIGSSTDDWDRYESLHWRATEDWLAEQQGEEPAAQEIRSANEEHKRRYVERRDALGWGIFLARKPN
ncbi:MAG TPA: methyltransferase domain-containing protein [Gaiellaceae bacterium]|jgi:SAM-dependent methyltransferase